jgi:transporter family protein
MKEWALPVLGTWLCWGLWGFLPKLTVQYLSPRSATIYQICGGLVVALLILRSLHFQPEAHPWGVCLAIATGVVGFLGALFYLAAVIRGPVILVVTLTALYPLLSIALAWLLLGETISLKQGLGLVFGLIALVLIAT